MFPHLSREDTDPEASADRQQAGPRCGADAGRSGGAGAAEPAGFADLLSAADGSGPGAKESGGRGSHRAAFHGAFGGGKGLSGGAGSAGGGRTGCEGLSHVSPNLAGSQRGKVSPNLTGSSLVLRDESEYFWRILP